MPICLLFLEQNKINNKKILKILKENGFFHLKKET